MCFRELKGRKIYKMILQLLIDKSWRELKGEREYKYARVTQKGTIRPVRYSGLSRVIGELVNREKVVATVRMNTTIFGWNK